MEKTCILKRIMIQFLAVDPNGAQHDSIKTCVRVYNIIPFFAYIKTSKYSFLVPIYAHRA